MKEAVGLGGREEGRGGGIIQAGGVAVAGLLALYMFKESTMFAFGIFKVGSP